MKHTKSTLNGDFGVMIEGVTRADLRDAAFRQEAYDLWTRHGGLIAVRGADLVDLSPEELMEWSELFGDVEYGNLAAREDKLVKGFPILKIGNIRDKDGKPAAQLATVPQLRGDRFEREPADLLGHGRVEEHLQQDVAELLLGIGVGAPVRFG